MLQLILTEGLEGLHAIGPAFAFEYRHCTMRQHPETTASASQRSCKIQRGAQVPSQHARARRERAPYTPGSRSHAACTCADPVALGRHASRHRIPRVVVISCGTRGTPECAHLVPPRPRVDDHMLICAAHEVLAVRRRVLPVDAPELGLASRTLRTVWSRTAIPRAKVPAVETPKSSHSNSVFEHSVVSRCKAKIPLRHVLVPLAPVHGRPVHAIACFISGI